MELKVIDTTLRDGEQQAGLALGIHEKVAVAELLDSLGVYQIEAGTPAMGGDEKKSIEKIARLNLRSRISAWNRMSINDVKHSIDCGVDVIHISVPSSDLHISTKFGKSEEWILEEMKKCIYFAKENRFIVNIGMEDASRARLDFLVRICEIAKDEGAEMVRYADTVGVLNPTKITDDILNLKRTGIELGIHAHNDFGMAIANTIAAVYAGAGFADCTISGIGERAGNCDFYDLIHAFEGMLPGFKYCEEAIKEKQRDILKILEVC